MQDNPVIALFIEAKAIAVAFLLAGFFGFVRYLQEFLGKEPPAFKWLIVATKVLTAGAAGLLVHWLTQEWKITANYGAFLIAVAGYGGAEFISAMKEAGLEVLRRRAIDGQNPGGKG